MIHHEFKEIVDKMASIESSIIEEEEEIDVNHIFTSKDNEVQNKINPKKKV